MLAADNRSLQRRASVLFFENFQEAPPGPGPNQVAGGGAKGSSPMSQSCSMSTRFVDPGSMKLTHLWPSAIFLANIAISPPTRSKTCQSWMHARGLTLPKITH